MSVGPSLADHARVLVRTHSAVLEGQTPAVPPREVIARSWRRVMALGLSADGSNARHPLPVPELERRRDCSPLRDVVDELTEVVGAGTDSSAMLLVVTDADGVILQRRGTSAVRRRADTLGFVEGAQWTEDRVGSNAIGTALAERAPVQMFSAEHFEATQHPWYCTAAPVHDPRTGRLLGILDVSGPAMTLHPAVGALVDAARRLAEARLWRVHAQRLDRLREAAAPVLASAGGPAVVVDDDGFVAHAIGVSVGERLAVPRADQPMSVPGLGVCLPERLGSLRHGWLVRSSGTRDEQAGVLDLHLDLTGDSDGSLRPVLLARSRTGQEWRHPLTARHAEILALLHAAGPSGLDATALSRSVYGDTDHVVTARAEVSRLRRVLGSVVLTGPFRLAPGTRMTVAPVPPGARP